MPTFAYGTYIAMSYGPILPFFPIKADFFDKKVADSYARITCPGTCRYNCITYMRKLTCFRIGCAPVGPRNVIDFLAWITSLIPALDDLNAIEVVAFGVFHRRKREGRRLCAVRPN